MKSVGLIVAFLAILGCQGTTSSPLLDGFNSHASFAEVKRALGDAKIAVVEDSHLPPGDQRPPFNILDISVRYVHLGQSGELILSFFNDRLMSTSFYPDDMKTYLEVLKDSGTALEGDGRSRMAPHTEVRRSTDFKGRAYVRWEDERLQEEFDEWIISYS